ncbi:MAG: BsuPI-related putative proteinase inhibitor [Bacillota bacterium]
MRRFGWKKLLTTLLAAALLLSTFSAAAFASPKWSAAGNKGYGHGHHFEDSDQAPWAADIIDKVFKKGFIKGVDAKHFQPNKPVTRAEAAIMIVRMLGLEDRALQSLQGTLPFIDDNDIPTWARGYINLMVAQGILNGIETGHGKAFQSMKPATRLEVTIMIIRALGLEDQAKANDGSSVTFTDKAAIRSSLLGYVALAFDKGIITGINGAFQPNKPVTRAEMAAILDRSSGNSSAQPGTVSGTLVSATTTGTLSVTIQKADNTQATYALADTATVTLNGAASTLADLQANDNISLTLGADGKATVVSATRTNPNSVTGSLVSATTIGTLSVTIQKADDTQATYVLADNATVTLNGAASTLASLQANDNVTLTLGADGKATAVAAARTQTVTGTVYSVAAPMLAVKKADNTVVTYEVAANATIKLNDATATLTQLQANDSVTVTLGTDNKVSSIVATRVDAAVANMALSLTTSKATYAPGEAVGLTFTVKNNNSTAVTVTFPTSQQDDFVVTQNGQAVWTWSDGQAFTQAVMEMTVAAGQTLTFQATWNQTNSAGGAVAVGQYAVKAQFKGMINNQTLPDQTVQFAIQQP